MVTVNTTSALIVVFAPRGLDPARLAFVLDRTSARMTQYTGGRERDRQQL
jgi:hypothetical protein